MKREVFQYDQIIREVGNELISQFDINKNVLSGINGPYNDAETIVRNLSHLIVITSIEIIIYKRGELRIPLIIMGDQLIKEAKSNGLYVLRSEKGKDDCNGVIGHAWVMEAFIYLYKVFRDKKYLEKALEIYNKHEFNFKLGLWNRPVDSTKTPNIDYTLNHQLWFSAISGELYEVTRNINISKDIERLFEQLITNTTIDCNGLIAHSIVNKISFHDIVKSNIKRTIDKVNRLLKRKSYSYKENGYHIFNIAALARLYKVFPENNFWSSKKFLKILKYTNGERLSLELLNPHVELDISLSNSIKNEYEKEFNIYGYPYNVPGFEMYYIKQVLGDRISDEVIKKYLSKQFELTYDTITGKFGHACFDKVTINYRIYEYYKALEERD